MPSTNESQHLTFTPAPGNGKPPALNQQQLIFTRLRQTAAMASGLEALASRALDDGEATPDQLDHIADLAGHLTEQLGHLSTLFAENGRESAMSASIIGHDVVGTQGQALTDNELTVLTMLADGGKPSDIAAAVGVDRAGLRHIEARIQAKLGATSKPHMIARGFILEVLAPRALCLLLAILSVGITPNGNAMRAPRRAGPQVTSMRASRSQRAGSNGHGDLLPIPILYAQAS